jgi:putative nucleic acid modification protein with dual OB domain
MSYQTRILCLANSRKPSGRCIAGKRYDNGNYGEWIRPVSSRPIGEVSEEERRYEDGRDPKLLDIIDIPMLRHQRKEYQQENHILDPDAYWVHRGRATWAALGAALDRPHGLWPNGYSTSAGLNDRVPEAIARALTSSLLLIQPEILAIWVGAPGADYGNPKRKVRAQFAYGGNRYNVTVTDPVIEREYFLRPNGEYPVPQAYLCLSLGELHEGFAYKLVAAVITATRAAAGE